MTAWLLKRILESIGNGSVTTKVVDEEPMDDKAAEKIIHDAGLDPIAAYARLQAKLPPRSGEEGQTL